MAEFRLEESSADNRLNRRLHQKIPVGNSCLPVIQMDMGTRSAATAAGYRIEKGKVFAGQRQRQNL
mgnify:CR=1 FL=1